MPEQIPNDALGSELEREEIAPLLDALHDDRPDVRVAVFDALLSLPLATDAWHDVRDYVSWAIKEGEAAPEHDEVVARAGRVPFRSVRAALIELAHGDDPTAPLAARSLAAAGDVAALEPLVNEVHTIGSERSDAVRYLAQIDVSSAAHELEQAYEAISPTQQDEAFWLAVALARAGNGAPLRSYITALDEGATPLPTLFWGDPEVARGALAAGRPLPEDVVAWLKSFCETSSADAETVVRILLDAHEPAVPAEPPPDVDPELIPDPLALSDASSVAKSLLDTHGHLREGWSETLDALPPNDRIAVVSTLVTQLLGSTERGLDKLRLGNEAVQLAYARATDFVPDVDSLAGLAGRDSSTSEQAAWAASRGGARLLLRRLSDSLADPGRREETARFIASAGRYLRSSDPLLVGGAPAEPPAAIPELIEDMVGANGDEDREVDAESSELKRTPHLRPSEEPLAPGQSFHVAVWADTEPPAPGESGHTVVVSAASAVPISVKIVPSTHFEVIDDVTVKPIVLDPAQKTTEKVTFALRVVDRPPSDTAPCIAAHFWKDGQRCGYVSRNVELAVVTSASTRAVVPAVITYVRGRSEPDLLVSIETASTDETESATTWGCTVVTRHLCEYEQGVPGKWQLKAPAREIVADYMRDFMDEANTHEQRANLWGAQTRSSFVESGGTAFAHPTPTYLDAWRVLIFRWMRLPSP